ncbi:MAG: polymer-forming cytoskeletal protein [Myxococcota bacterium]|nr:polymer-forming cytoskeletal protein [Myxococcota bacterium]
MSAHLDEIALEALANGREDLVAEEALDHLDECAACAERVELERRGAMDASLALRRAMPELDELDAMIAQAMTHAPDELSPAPSRRSLWWGAAVGGLAAAALGVLSLPALPTSFGGVAGGAASTGGQLITLWRAVDSLVEATVPGGWIAVSVIGLVLAALLAMPMRLLLGPRKLNGLGPLASALGVILFALAAMPGAAHAYRVEGAWPDPEPTVSVDVTDQPTSEALRQAASSAGLGVVIRLDDDPRVTLHVQDAPIGEVIEALLGERPVVVRPGASLITVRPDEPAPVEEAPPEREPLEARQIAAAVAPPAPPPASRPPPAPAGVSDRVNFGGDVEVGEDEQVRDVITMGGDAEVRGRAYGDVVTMGGDAEIAGEVIGNVMTMGGDIELLEGAVIHGEVNAMGGEIDVEDGAVVHGAMHSEQGEAFDEPAEGRAAPEKVVSSSPGFFRWALWNVLLFLLGLVLLGTARKRFSNLRGELAARPLRSAFGGLLGALCGGILVVVFAVTLIGLPASVVLGGLLFVGLWMGWTTSAWWIGSVLPFALLEERPVAQLAVGVGVLFVVGLVPKVGTLLVLGAILAGLGAVIATGFGNQSPRKSGARHVPTGPFRTSA